MATPLTQRAQYPLSKEHTSNTLKKEYTLHTINHVQDPYRYLSGTFFLIEGYWALLGTARQLSVWGGALIVASSTDAAREKVWSEVPASA